MDTEWTNRDYPLRVETFVDTSERAAATEASIFSERVAEAGGFVPRISTVIGPLVDGFVCTHHAVEYRAAKPVSRDGVTDAARERLGWGTSGGSV